LKIASGLASRLRHAARVDLAQGRGLLGHELHVGLRSLEQLLEGCHGRLAVFVVGVHDGPALLLELGGLGHQHGGLHVGAGAQAEGVLVAALPGDLVGQRFAGKEEELLLLGKVGHGQAGVRQEGAGEHVDLFARDEFFGHAHGVAGVGVVVARDQLDLLAVDAARGIDFIDGEFHPLLVGLEEGRLRLVAVDLTDLDDALRLRDRNQCDGERSERHHVEGKTHGHGELLVEMVNGTE
jgi:hypothetical protein